MKLCLRLLTGVLALSFLPLWLCAPPLCLFLSAWDYAWKGPAMATVRQQQTKAKELRKHLVAWVNARPGTWTLGGNIADTVLAELKGNGISTFSNVLSKELRKAERKGEIRKRINDDRMVEYTAVAPSGMLFHAETKIHGETVTTRRGDG